MTDPFVQGSAPQRVGFARIDQDASLYYEIRHGRDTRALQKVLMIMGAFATSRKFDCIATALAEHGYEVQCDQILTSTAPTLSPPPQPQQVLTYHHRNIGKTLSPASKHVPQTPTTLAHDAMALVNHVWGSSTPIHVFGASMGGVVAQYMAVLLHNEGRFGSLFVNVTWDGSGRMGNSLVASLLKPLCTLSMVRHVLLPLVFPHRNMPSSQATNTMKSVYRVGCCCSCAYSYDSHCCNSHCCYCWHHHTCVGRTITTTTTTQTYTNTDMAQPYTGIGTNKLPPNPTVGDAWHYIWSTELDDWFCWRDPDTTAVQLHLLIHTTPVDVSSLRNDPTVPPRCSVFVAEQDALVPPAQQEEVAVRLGTTNVLRLHTGHMIGNEEVCVWMGEGGCCSGNVDDKCV